MIHLSPPPNIDQFYTLCLIFVGALFFGVSVALLVEMVRETIRSDKESEK